jgi:FKBP-type peptidyl-prolyl cis-trans isomerase
MGWLQRLFGRGPRAPHFVPPSQLAWTERESGLGVSVEVEGAGEQPGPSDRVEVRYAGWLEDGKAFDASWSKTATFPLDRVIPGWTEGVGCLRPGGRAWLRVPPHLGYGSRGAPPRIPPRATLVFCVELVRVIG